MMSASQDDSEYSPSLNSRLRPRKSIVSNQDNKVILKSDHSDKSKRNNSSQKQRQEVSTDISDVDIPIAVVQLLCPYCERSFSFKQSLAKHVGRVHFGSSRQNTSYNCNFCSYVDHDSFQIISHMVESHEAQYIACLICLTRFSTRAELEEHRTTNCDKSKILPIRPYHSKLRQKCRINVQVKQKSAIGSAKISDDNITKGPGSNGIVISCELKPTQIKDVADIEENIPTNVILPTCKNLSNSSVLEKNAVIVLDDIQWNKRIPPNLSFNSSVHTDQILSRLGVVHRSHRVSESSKREWHRHIDESNKFERCFDTTFYSKVASNVQENLTRYLDGSFNRVSWDGEPIKTRKSKNSVMINTVEGFPILLASEQYSRNANDGYLPRPFAPKHKWKWDSNENEKQIIVLNEDQVKKDNHTNNCIITLVSSLDMWTQLCMRHKFEAKFCNSSVTERKTEKQNIICKELKEILESREIPNSSGEILKFTKPTQSTEKLDFPTSLGLMPATPNYEVKPAVLSGEWVRPRCYVCCACGEQTQDSKALSSHISSRHPNAYITYYEIVGEMLHDADILKHLYVPQNQVFNRSRPPRGSRDCTKCKKSVLLEELHQHMLECAGDTPTIRRKCRYRPFGVRRRRPRLPDNRIRKQIRKDMRISQKNMKSSLMRPRPRIRTDVGDAETIRKMLADLPAKRHRISTYLNSPAKQFRNIDKQRKLIKFKSIEELTNRKCSHKLTIKRKTLQKDNLPASASPQVEDLKLRENPINQKTETVSRKVTVLKTVKRTLSRQQAAQSRKNKRTVINKNITMTTNTSTNNLVLINSENAFKLDKSSGNPKECSSNYGSSNHREEQNIGAKGSKSDDNSRHSSPSRGKAPLKHSISSLTNTENTKFVNSYSIQSLQQKHINDGNVKHDHLFPGSQLLVENEIAATKLDKPPLFNIFSQNLGVHKAKSNKTRKGLNDCIAMLKNKLVDSASDDNSKEDTSDDTVSSANNNLQIESKNCTKNTCTKMVEDLERTKNPISKLPDEIVLPSVAPLDLSGKRQKPLEKNLESKRKSTEIRISDSEIIYTSLDLTCKSLIKTSKMDDVTKISSNTESIGTLDLSKNAVYSSDYISKLTTDATKTIDNSIKSTKLLEHCPKPVVESKKNLEKPIPKQISNRCTDKAFNQKSVYDPTLKIPQYKIRANSTESNPVKDIEKYKESDKTTLVNDTSSNISLLPKEIVDILGTMPAQHRNTLLNVLPQVFAKTVNQLKLAVDSGSKKEMKHSPDKTEIATQTSCNTPEQNCPPEFLNIDTDKYLIDPVTGAITERPQKDLDTTETNQISGTITLQDIIDLTSEDDGNMNKNIAANKLKLTDNSKLIADFEPLDKSVNLMPEVEKCPPASYSSLTRQKISNDKTASLRAVRIKPTVEKNKALLPIDSSNMNNILPQEIIIHDTSTYRGLLPTSLAIDNIEKDASLAIQQSEVSSTQHSGTQIILSNVSTADKVNLESAVHNHDNVLQSTCAKVNDFQTTVNYHLIDGSGINVKDNRLVSKMSNNQPSAEKDCLYPKHQIVLEKPELLNTRELRGSDEYSININDCLHKQGTDCKNFPNKSTDNCNENKVGILESRAKLIFSDEEDPEDDISLATIVKQKLLYKENSNDYETIKNVECNDKHRGTSHISKAAEKSDGANDKSSLDDFETNLPALKEPTVEKVVNETIKITMNISECNNEDNNQNKDIVTEATNCINSNIDPENSASISHNTNKSKNIQFSSSIKDNDSLDKGRKNDEYGLKDSASISHIKNKSKAKIIQFSSGIKDHNNSWDNCRKNDAYGLKDSSECGNSLDACNEFYKHKSENGKKGLCRVKRNSNIHVKKSLARSKTMQDCNKQLNIKLVKNVDDESLQIEPVSGSLTTLILKEQSTKPKKKGTKPSNKLSVIKSRDFPSNSDSSNFSELYVNLERSLNLSESGNQIHSKLASNDSKSDNNELTDSQHANLNNTESLSLQYCLENESVCTKKVFTDQNTNKTTLPETANRKDKYADKTIKVCSDSSEIINVKIQQSPQDETSFHLKDMPNKNSEEEHQSLPLFYETNNLNSQLPNIPINSDTSFENITREKNCELRKSDGSIDVDINNVKEKSKNEKKDKKYRQTKKSLNLVADFANIENRAVSSPLRRSLRGKYSTDNTQDIDDCAISSDIDVAPKECKGPLTKKQLIFSKLMLDEENSKISINMSENDKSTISVENIYSLCENKDNVEKPVTTDEIVTMEIQSKLTKRKITTFNKRTAKKLKSSLSYSHDDIAKSVLDESKILHLDNIEFADFTNAEEYVSSKNVEINKQYKISSSNVPNDVETMTNTELKCNLNTTLKVQKPIQKEITQKLRKSAWAFNDNRLELCNSHSQVLLTDDFSDTTKASSNSFELNVELGSKYLPTNNTKNVIRSHDDDDESNSQDFHRGNELKRFIAPKNKMGINNSNHKLKKTKTLKKKAKSKQTKIISDSPCTAVSEQLSEDSMKKETWSRKAYRSNNVTKQKSLPNLQFLEKDNKINNIFSNVATVSNSKFDNPIFIHESDSMLSNSTVISVEHCKSSIKTDDILSDSDDSSKSDIPLKKYVKDNSKTEHKLVNPQTTKVNLNAKKRTKKRRRTLGVCNDVNNVTTDKTKEISKSEQFMESFGFFSERTPRKSNLLASKKISETFHVIGNDSDDSFLGNKEKTHKKSQQNENKKAAAQAKCVNESNISNDSTVETDTPAPKKKGRRKRVSKSLTFCNICQKQFRRPDNFLRHQMTLYHISKLSELEMKFDTVPYPNSEQPNYLIAYKHHIERLRQLGSNGNKIKPSQPEKIDLNSLLAMMNTTETYKPSVPARNITRRGLSRDEALFLDCCELLKSNKNDGTNTDNLNISNASNKEYHLDSFLCSEQHSPTEYDNLVKSDSINKLDSKSDGDVDSITAKNILESEEVRNLENDLISGLKQAVANANTQIHNHVIENVICECKEKEYHNKESDKSQNKESTPLIFPSLDDEVINSGKSKRTRNFLDQSEDIDIFEDKFDKIKRKCRSQAAAAKNIQIISEANCSRKSIRKSEKKSRGRKNSKKSHQNTILTKGALKGFDGIKVSIPTSDINISAIVPAIHDKSKKKKKNYGKKKKNYDIRDSLDDKANSTDDILPNKKLKQVDVYEFMDNEDTEMLDYRTATKHDRFKGAASKEFTTYNSMVNSPVRKSEDTQASLASCSDGDDFVYMSDDYSYSDDTESSLLSSETGNLGKSDRRNYSSKKRDTAEKNAVMGKIFKNNAVRNDKRNGSRVKELKTDKANLDQLFDSLLRNEPSTSTGVFHTIPSNRLTPDEVIETNSADFDKLNSDNETGVARHRARRKCTVGKQNILAETWSSESEPDAIYNSRPNSVESVAPVVGRKRKSKKGASQRNRDISFIKNHDNESRVKCSSNVKNSHKEKSSRSESTYHWSSSEEDDPHALVEQHGWIVGDSHKKLVTMLAHAKGRKHDDKRNLDE